MKEITTLIGAISFTHKGGRLHGVDIRVYRWLEQWLSADEARALIHSLVGPRLTALIVQYHREMSAIPVWSD